MGAAEPFVRVNLTLRPGDTALLHQVALNAFLGPGDGALIDKVRRGERISASMGVRHLLDEYRKKRARKKVKS